MGSFNFVVFHWPCPVCKVNSEIRCQLHHVSSFDGFHGKTYAVRTRLPWFAESHPEYPTWRNILGRVDRSGLADDEEEEICYGNCNACSCELLVLIRVSKLTPEVIAVHGPEGPDGDDWGAGYTGGYAI